MNRLTLLVCAVLLAGVTSLSAQMRERGPWRGGHFFGPNDDRFRDRWEFRRDSRDLHPHRMEALRERRRLREQFRRDMRDWGREFRFRYSHGYWN